MDSYPFDISLEFLTDDEFSQLEEEMLEALRHECFAEYQG